MGRISFIGFFEAARNAGAYSCTREGASAEFPFSEAIEKSLSSEQPGPVPDGQGPCGAKQCIESPSSIRPIEQLPPGVSENGGGLRPFPVSDRETTPFDQTPFDPGKIQLLREALQVLRHPGDRGAAGESKANFTAALGGKESEPENAFDSTGLKENGKENPASALHHKELDPLSLAVTERQPVQDDTVLPVSEASFQKVLVATAEESPERGGGISHARGQKARSGSEERARLSVRPVDAGSEAGTFFFVGNSGCPADSPRLSAELIGSPEIERENGSPLPALSFSGLTGGVSKPQTDVASRGSRFQDGTILRGIDKTEEPGSRQAGFGLESLLEGQISRRQDTGSGGGRSIPFRLPLNASLSSTEAEKKNVEKKSGLRWMQEVIPVGELPRGQSSAGPSSLVASRTPALESGIMQMTVVLSSKGRHRGILRLHPPELGDVRVVLFSVGEKVRLHLTVESQDVREALHSFEPRLREGLGHQGILLGEMTVDVNGEPGQGFGPPNSGKESVFPAAASEENSAESDPEELVARLDLVSGLFSWVA